MRKRKLRKKARNTIIILVVLGLFLIATSITYCYLATPVDLTSSEVIEVDIKQGMSTREIATLLEKSGLIRSGNFFLVYTKLNKCSSLKASSYELGKNMSLPDILDKICSGNTYNEEIINITFKEGKRITDYAKVVEEETNNSSEDFLNTMKDTAYIETLINKYWFLSDEILEKDIYYPLEGYLYPDTYQFENKNVKVTKIVEDMLDQTDKILTSNKSKIESSKHTLHEILTLASMAELEGTTTENRKMIVGVFENRLDAKMNLGSDVTTYYALQKPMTSDLTVSEFATKNPYNTRSSNLLGLPIGPICSVSTSSLTASLEPTQNSYYYFVADKNGEIYYTKTSSEHTKKVQEIKEAGNWIW